MTLRRNWRQGLKEQKRPKNLWRLEQQVFEEEVTENSGTLEELIDCVRYGLMEIGGFVRNQTLSTEQRAHMLVQERGNLVVWNVRNRAETADAIMEMDAQQETGEPSSWLSR